MDRLCRVGAPWVHPGSTLGRLSARRTCGYRLPSTPSFRTVRVSVLTRLASHEALEIQSDV